MRPLSAFGLVIAPDPARHSDRPDRNPSRPGRTGFAATERSTTPLTTLERQQLSAGLHLDDPRWILNLLIFGVFLLAAHFSRVRYLKLTKPLQRTP